MQTNTQTTPSILVLGFLIAGLVAPLHGEPVSLQSLVTPSTIIQKDRQPVTFALHGFIEFQSLAELFAYIKSQTTRWSRLDQSKRWPLAHELLRRGVESRVISMTDERPLETLITHTAAELRQAIANVQEPVPRASRFRSRAVSGECLCGRVPAPQSGAGTAALVRRPTHTAQLAAHRTSAERPAEVRRSLPIQCFRRKSAVGGSRRRLSPRLPLLSPRGPDSQDPR